MGASPAILERKGPSPQRICGSKRLQEAHGPLDRAEVVHTGDVARNQAGARFAWVYLVVQPSTRETHLCSKKDTHAPQVEPRSWGVQKLAVQMEPKFLGS